MINPNQAPRQRLSTGKDKFWSRYNEEKAKKDNKNKSLSFINKYWLKEVFGVITVVIVGLLLVVSYHTADNGRRLQGEGTGEAEAKMTVWVKPLDRESFQVDVGADATIEDVRALAELPTGTRLSFGGRELDRSALLSDSGVGADAELVAVDMMKQAVTGLNAWWAQESSNNIFKQVCLEIYPDDIKEGRRFNVLVDVNKDSESNIWIGTYGFRVEQGQLYIFVDQGSEQYEDPMGSVKSGKILRFYLYSNKATSSVKIQAWTFDDSDGEKMIQEMMVWYSAMSPVGPAATGITFSAHEY